MLVYSMRTSCYSVYAVIFGIKPRKYFVSNMITLKATQIIDFEKLKIEFLSSAEPYLQQKAKLSDHDANLALLEFELIQRRKMNSILKQKQVFKAHT